MAQPGPWLRLEAIKIQLHDNRLKERCKRYIAIWRWATKRKCEKRAIQSFSKVLANRSDEAIQGISNVIKPIFGAKITKKDLEWLAEIKNRKLQGKYFDLWKKEVSFRRNEKQKLLKSFTISNHHEMPKLFQLRQEQKHRLMHGSNMLFPNRKRKSLSEINPECSSIKRFLTSTPSRGSGGSGNAFILDISPVIRTSSPADSNHDTQENAPSNMKELNNSFEKISQLLQQTKQRNFDIQSRYKNLFADSKT
uniref:Uncharacterized protein n=1 Tax=Panagrolaimus sp. ES5 TaxID=591445 RepID=A0AC34FKV4_9BILA